MLQRHKNIECSSGKIQHIQMRRFLQNNLEALKYRRGRSEGGGAYLVGLPELLGHGADLGQEVTDEEGPQHAAAPQCEQELRQPVRRLELQNSSCARLNVHRKQHRRLRPVH